MSKIGKINIAIPEKVKVILNGNLINIEGPLGKKSLNVYLDIFLSIFFSKGSNLNSFSFNFEEKILSLIDSFLVPFGPEIVKFDPSIFIEESLGIVIFFFPIFDIKIPYKLFLHQHCFFLLLRHSLHLLE